MFLLHGEKSAKTDYSTCFALAAGLRVLGNLIFLENWGSIEVQGKNEKSQTK
jgi:hypothetical protein